MTTTTNEYNGESRWNTEPAHEPLYNVSLEHLIKNIGETDFDKAKDPQQKSIGGQSDILTAMLRLLHQRNRNRNQGEIQRLVFKMGIDIMEARFKKKIRTIDELHSRITESADVLDITLSLRTDNFTFCKTISVHPHKIYLRPWQIGTIANKISEPLNLYFSIAVQLTLMAGITKSEVQIPRKLVQLALDELENFDKYLDKQEETLNGLLK
jgi:hypothetical protein